MNRFYSTIIFVILTFLLLGCREEPKVIAPSSPPPAPPPTTAPPPAPPPSAEDVKAAQALRQSGLDYRRQGRYPEAVTALEKSVDLDPQNLSGRVILGWTLHLAGQQQEAIQALEAAQDSNHVPALNALGIVYLVSGDLDSAVATHTKAVELKPNNDIGYYNLSLAYHRLQQYEQAIATGNEAAALEPGNPHHWVALALPYWDQGEEAMAQQMYQKAVDLDARYRSSEFLAHLEQAGFSPEQIQTAKLVGTRFPRPY